MTDVLALDVANFQGDINGLLDAHPEVQRVVVRCSLERPALEAITRQQCQTVRDRGLGLDTYCWCYATADDPDTLAARSYALVGEYAPDWYWLDCEETPPGTAQSWTKDAPTNIAWLHRAVDGFRALGLQVGIYTGYWFWTPATWMANTPEFCDLPLWAATDTKVPDRGQGWAFGGWEPPFAGVQYDLSGPDLDVFDGALYENGGTDVDAAERAELENLRTYVSTLLGTEEAPGGVIGANLAAMEAAAGQGTSKLASTVRQKCSAIREAAGIP